MPSGRQTARARRRRLAAVPDEARAAESAPEDGSDRVPSASETAVVEEDLPGQPDAGVPVPTDAPAEKRSRRRRPPSGARRRPGWSLRAHLLLVVLSAIALVGVAETLTSLRDLDRSRQRAASEARFRAQLAAQEIGAALPELRNLMVRSADNVADSNVGRPLAALAEQCNLRFTEYGVFTGGALHIIGLPEGNVICSSLPREAPRPPGGAYANAPWVAKLNPPQPVGTATRALIGPPGIDPATGRWSLPIVGAIRSVDRNVPRVAGAIVLALDLTRLGPDLADRFCSPPKARGQEHCDRSVEYLITDEAGGVVESRSTDGSWAGRTLEGGGLFGAADTPGGARLTDLDGVERVYGGARVVPPEGAEEPRWHVYAGITTERAEAPARATLRERVQADLGVLFALALITLSGMLTVRRR